VKLGFIGNFWICKAGKGADAELNSLESGDEGSVRRIVDGDHFYSQRHKVQPFLLIRVFFSIICTLVERTRIEWGVWRRPSRMCFPMPPTPAIAILIVW
jgi:hypothetical protein